MTAPATPAVGDPAICPVCGAPVSPRASSCAFCDATLRAEEPGDPEPARPVRSARSAARHAGRRLLRALVALAAVVVVLVAAAATGVAWLVAHRAAARAEATRASMLRVLDRRRAVWPGLAVAVRRAAGLEGRATAADRDAARALLAASYVLRRPSRPDEALAALDMDTTAALRLGTDGLRDIGAANLSHRLVRMRGGARLADSVRARLAADTLTPWLAVWRRMGASGAYPTAWMYRPGVPGVRYAYALPVTPFSTRGIGAANAGAALLALEAGDGATAERRARENLAVAYAHLRAPTLMSHLLGRVLAAEGARLLAHVGRVRGDAALQAEGEAMTEQLEQLVFAQPTSLYGLAGTRDSLALAVAGDTLLPPAVRVDGALSIMTAACTHPGEILFGPAARRREDLRLAAARLRDLDAEGRLLPLVEREYDGWSRLTSDGARELMGRPFRSGGALRALRVVGLRGVMGRTIVCTML